MWSATSRTKIKLDEKISELTNGTAHLEEKYGDILCPKSSCMGLVRMAQQEEKYAEKRIDENWTKLEQRGERNFFISKIKNNRLKDEIVRYTLALEEIQEMRESDMIFDFKTYRKKDYEDIDKLGNTYTRGSRGYISYDPDKNVCTIHVNEEGGLCLGDFAHELKHGYQFMVGRLSFKINPNGGETAISGYLYDYIDELDIHHLFLS